MIGKLYVVPFTSILIAAVDSKDAQTVVSQNTQFVKDLYKTDIVCNKGNYTLAKPHLGIREIVITPAFMEVYNK